MTADDAFERLMSKNALPIPVANPAAEARREAGTDTTRVTGQSPAQPVRPTRVRPQPAQEPVETMRVNLMDEDPGDYQPAGYSEDEGDGVFTTPTEADLEAVDDEEADPDVESAYQHGARIIGRDAGDTEYAEPLDDDVQFRDADVLDDDADENGDADGGDAALDRARRVRRFAYIPLSGMESFESRARDLMARLQSQEPERPSLAVTSPGRGEGQTELAIRLALALAKRVDYRVLLADFDVRRPQMAARLGVSAKYFTTADVLRGSCQIGEALAYSEEDNLFFLPARASDRDGDEFLNDRQVQSLVGQLHEAFDFTIIGCGPMDHADAAIICRHTGAAALAGYCNSSRAKPLREAADRLSEAGARVAGLLLTGA